MERRRYRQKADLQRQHRSGTDRDQSSRDLMKNQSQRSGVFPFVVCHVEV